MKKNNGFLMIILTIFLIIVAAFLNSEDEIYSDKMSNYVLINKLDSIVVEVYSTLDKNKFFIINDKWTCYAIQRRESKILFLSDYLRKSDLLVKRINNDTIYIFRNHSVEKFIIP